jgi:hypothetical protein
VSIYLSIYTIQNIRYYLSICLSIYVYIYVYIYVSIYLFLTLYLSIYLSRHYINKSKNIDDRSIDDGYFLIQQESIPYHLFINLISLSITNTNNLKKNIKLQQSSHTNNTNTTTEIDISSDRIIEILRAILCDVFDTNCTINIFLKKLSCFIKGLVESNDKKCYVYYKVSI